MLQVSCNHYLLFSYCSKSSTKQTEPKKLAMAGNVYVADHGCLRVTKWGSATITVVNDAAGLLPTFVSGPVTVSGL
jgi:hypothetical protein